MSLSPKFPRLHCVKIGPFAILLFFLLTNFTGVLIGRAFAPGTDVSNSIENLEALTSGDAELDQLIINIGEAEGVDPRFIHAVIWQESKYDQQARSPVGAQGLMQLMPATARRFGCNDPNDAAENIAAGTKYLSWLLKRFDGNVELALAGYNAGEGSVDKYDGIPPYRETQNYVRIITSRYGMSRSPILATPVPKVAVSLVTAN
jgi:soluble lytic murein transglycosylase-like protein